MRKLLSKVKSFVLEKAGIRSLEAKTDNIMEQVHRLNEAVSACNNQLQWLKDFNCKTTDITTVPSAYGNIRLQQKAGTKILEIFDTLCQNLGLTYWVGAGNLLGIVRHNGKPVPWDDDIDVYMLRPDFNKALNIMPNLFKGTGFALIYRGFSLKYIRYKNAAISFDIFPIDQYHKKITSSIESDELRKKVIAAHSCSREMYFVAAGYASEYDFFINMWGGGEIKTPEKLAELSEIARQKWNAVVMEGKEPAPDGGLVKGYERAGWGAKQYIWDYDWIFPLKRALYDGVETNIPNNPNLYLNSQYGDYWSFPNDFHVHTSHLELAPEQIASLVELSELNTKEFVEKMK